MDEKEIVWTPTAENSLKELTGFYFELTNSNKYSNSLIEQVNRLILNIKNFNLLGRQVENATFRVVYFGYFGIFYRPAEDRIYIELIWDNRRNPDNLKKLLNIES